MAKSVLVIEDDADILSTVENVLTFNNFEVTGLTHTNDILESIRQHQPDLVLTDYMLPGMNGGKICQTIKATPETKHIPVILISAYHRQAIKLANFNYDAYIPKPFDIDKLVNTINKLLN
jgi:two-component system phosphate regulon response regulator PhoB